MSAYFPSIRSTFSSHLIYLVLDCHALVELNNHARMILNEKFTVHKFHMTASFLHSNFCQLSQFSSPKQGEKKQDVLDLKDELQLGDKLGPTPVTNARKSVRGKCE
jgi:hypothetical protein